MRGILDPIVSPELLDSAAEIGVATTGWLPPYGTIMMLASLVSCDRKYASNLVYSPYCSDNWRMVRPTLVHPTLRISMSLYYQHAGTGTFNGSVEL
jgi:hypothetical protein